MENTASQPDNNLHLERGLDAIARAILGTFGSATNGSAYVATLEATASAAYVDLTTVTDTVTVNVGAKGVVLVTISALMYNNTATGHANMGFAMSGANTMAAQARYSIDIQEVAANYTYTIGSTFLITGLSPGSTTFKLKYLASVAGTANFQQRQIGVLAL